VGRHHGWSVVPAQTGHLITRRVHALQDDLWHSIVLVQPGNAAGVGLLLVDGQPMSLAPLGMSAAHAAAPYWLDDFGGEQGPA